MALAHIAYIYTWRERMWLRVARYSPRVLGFVGVVIE